MALQHLLRFTEGDVEDVDPTVGLLFDYVGDGSAFESKPTIASSSPIPLPGTSRVPDDFGKDISFAASESDGEALASVAENLITRLDESADDLNSEIAGGQEFLTFELRRDSNQGFGLVLRTGLYVLRSVRLPRLDSWYHSHQ